MAMIRAGLLHIPRMDLDAGAAVRRLLHAEAPSIVVLQESYAADQRHWIEETLRRWCDEDELDLVLTIGGTLPAPGPSGREVTPEATLAVVERLLPGLPEAMRADAQETTALALLDRGVAGIRGRTAILNLPAGAGPAVYFLEAVVDLLPPLLAHLQGDPAAPSLADAFDAGSVEVGEVEEDEAEGGDETGTAEPEASSHRGLNAADFAAFLQRRKQAGPPEEE
jgi:molybdopterin biosynthesis enzyme MoaB